MTIANKLTTLKVKNLTEPGRYGDGNGLYLIVDKSGAKRWMLRTVVHGKRCDIGLGGFTIVSLADARKEALRMRSEARRGMDPLAERRRLRRAVPTFEDAARELHAELLPTWKNAKHGNQWINTLSEYAFPMIGLRRINQITTVDVMSVLSPIWAEKPETARRVMQRLQAVFDWSRSKGFVDGENPVSGAKAGLPKIKRKPKHHRRMPIYEIPQFMALLNDIELSVHSAGALKLLILNASRTSEIINAKWIEFDLGNSVWTIPPERMKAEVEHRIPLSDSSVELINKIREFSTGSPFLFPSAKGDQRPISNMAMTKLLKRMNQGCTVHGFRSTFRDWAAEQTSFPHEVCEMALAHSISNKAEAAYRRGDLFNRRRDLMQAWSNYCNQRGENVIHMNLGHHA